MIPPPGGPKDPGGPCHWHMNVYPPAGASVDVMGCVVHAGY